MDLVRATARRPRNLTLTGRTVARRQNLQGVTRLILRKRRSKFAVSLKPAS